MAYRKALLLDPALVPALVNLANIHYARDNLVEAQALYERALALDGDCFEAAFNLGNIHHDLGRYGDAVACYPRRPAGAWRVRRRAFLSGRHAGEDGPLGGSQTALAHLPRAGPRRGMERSRAGSSASSA